MNIPTTLTDATFESQDDADRATEAIDWNRLVTRNWGLIVRICRAQLRGWGDSDIEDCAQGAIVHILDKARKGFRYRAGIRCASPEVFAGVCVKNYASNWRALAHRSKPHVGSDTVAELAAPMSATAGIMDASPYQSAERRVSARELATAMAKLTPAERTTLLGIGSGESQTDIARSTGVSNATVTRFKKDATAKLAAALR